MGDSMSTIINATTTNGVVIQPDNSGSLVLQTNSGTTALTIDTSQRAAFVAGTAALPAITTTGDTNTGMWFPAADTIAFAEGGTESMRIDSSGNVIVNDTAQSGSAKLTVKQTVDTTIGGIAIVATDGNGANLSRLLDGGLTFRNGGVERMRIKSDGTVMIGTTTDDQWFTSTNTGFNFNAGNFLAVARSGGSPIIANRLTSDGDVIEIRQAGTTEGTISVSGTTVSYNGGHLSRWSQLYNETTKVNVYRGTVLESVDAMCVWEKDGEPLPNEQATKTIVSNTPSSKAVAGVFDRYDEDDETNPYDFYVAQSGDFVIRIAQGVTVQNGDLLESAGDGTARPQADDICRSSTIAKVTSNYVSATYEDGSYCVPCILMIG
jgi:hypothetical protein